MHDLAAELRVLPEQIEVMKAMALGITGRLTGMPIGTGRSDKVGNSTTKLVYLEELWEKQREKYVYKLIELTVYINGIDDPEMRSIIRSRCAGGRTWQEVADELGLGSEDTVKSKYHRFFRKENEVEC